MPVGALVLHFSVFEISAFLKTWSTARPSPPPFAPRLNPS